MTEDSSRSMPGSELDLNLMLTDSVWGRPEISEELKERLKKHFLDRDEKGKPIYIKDENGNFVPTGSTQSLWGMLGFFTRDMRLANLSRFDGEIHTCRYMIDLANDLLQVDMIEPFLISLARAASILETSQSKGGFLRKITNTLIQKNIAGTDDPPKKSLFGIKKKKESEYG